MEPCEELEGIEIRKMQRDLEYEPCFGFSPKLRGQAVYILHKCKEEGIQARYCYGEVQIFSRKKLEKFKEVVMSSFKQKSEGPELVKSSHAFYSETALLCVMLKKDDETYVAETHFPTIIELQFMGKIPITKNYIIFRTQHEMKEDLLKKGIVV